MAVNTGLARLRRLRYLLESHFTNIHFNKSSAENFLKLLFILLISFYAM